MKDSFSVLKTGFNVYQAGIIKVNMQPKMTITCYFCLHLLSGRIFKHIPSGPVYTQGYGSNSELHEYFLMVYKV